MTMQRSLREACERHATRSTWREADPGWYAPVGKAALCFLIAAPLGLRPGSSQGAESGAPLVLERTNPLTGVAGRIDHMAIDLARKRLIVANSGTALSMSSILPPGTSSTGSRD